MTIFQYNKNNKFVVPQSHPQNQIIQKNSKKKKKFPLYKTQLHRTRPITPINYRDNHQNEHSQLKEKIYKYKKGKKHAKIVKFAVTLIKRKLCATPALASCHGPLARVAVQRNSSRDILLSWRAFR